MPRSYYDVQQVCLNGHQITDRYNEYPQHRREHCRECGADTIHECPECGNPIPGDYVVPGVFAVGSSTSIPSHCESCGEPFPWAEAEESPRASEQIDLSAALDRVRHICERFPLVVRCLRDRHNDRETLDVRDEYDVQDLLYALLRLFFDDVRREEYSPSYAGSSSRIDFLVKQERIAVEVKVTRESLGDEEIGGQLLTDIGRYADHPSVETLACFVYDPDLRLTNPPGLRSDLENREDLDVEVLVAPRGY